MTIRELLKHMLVDLILYIEKGETEYAVKWDCIHLEELKDVDTGETHNELLYAEVRDWCLHEGHKMIVYIK